MTELQQLPAPLMAWYRAHARSLPWRSDPTPYHVWVSEIMLQQTRVAAVLGYYARFMEALPTIQDLAACPQDRLMKLWQGLGYYSRARNLQKAARQIVEELGGEIPAEPKALRTLPGVGEYTAGAIASIAFGKAVPAVDGNVLRVVSRLTGDCREMDALPIKREVARALAAVMPQERPGDFNQALMDLGAMVCLPGGEPLCGQCPAIGFCVGYREGSARDLPVKKPKVPRKVEERTVYLIFRKGRVALRRRPEQGLLAGLWEYPNEPTPWPCPVKGERRPAGQGRHVFTHLEWHMEAWAVRAVEEALPEGWAWAEPEELAGAYAAPSAFRAFAQVVEAELAEEKPCNGRDPIL
ncbi:A/G-specific adenine glycosylase [Acutalibacter intestini]|uniref:A/G-specific adenine glycosylase n=1 Tax=Acutalibacter intestini TaxID=3093659 RepID=UPI002AC915C8|nr:A/G-specific adenine glycosylase [Acutalibacter sp. M00204]